MSTAPKAADAAAGTAVDPKVGGNVRLVVFDFDQTLSAVHCFGSLAGTVGIRLNIVPPPYAQSEAGQMSRVKALIDSRSSYPTCPEFGFLGAAFGGDRRILELRELLEQLEARGVEMVICTKGLVGTAKLILRELTMLRYFREVYGNIGTYYGETQYDEDLAKEPVPSDIAELLGRENQAQWPNKDALIRQLMAQRMLKRGEVLFVDDDEEEIQKAQATCQTLWVDGGKGIGSKEFEWLRCNCVDESQGGRRGVCDVDFSQCVIS